MNWTLRAARRLVVAVIGLTVVILGLIMLVTPGPAMVVIPAGLMILATEFAWARHLLKRVRREVALRTGLPVDDDADDEDKDGESSPGGAPETDRPPPAPPGVPGVARQPLGRGELDSEP